YTVVNPFNHFFLSMDDLTLDNSLLHILTTETDENLHHLIEERLKHLPVDQQLDHLIDLFQSATDHQQIIHEAIIAAWAYLVEKNIWITRYPTLTALQLQLLESSRYSTCIVLGTSVSLVVCRLLSLCCLTLFC